MNKTPLTQTIKTNYLEAKYNITREITTARAFLDLETGFRQTHTLLQMQWCTENDITYEETLATIHLLE